MKRASLVVCLLVLLIASGAPYPVGAQENLPHASLMVSRDADGSINKESRQALRRLSRIANRNGHVRVWVTLDTPFDPFLSQKLDKEAAEKMAAEQQERVDNMFDELLAPLLREALVQYQTGERSYMGPSLMLKVTKKGLLRLATDQRVGQLVGVREQA